MDLLVVAREAPGLEPTAREIADPADARRVLPKLPHGAHIAPLIARLAPGVMVLSSKLDRRLARDAIGVAIQRVHPKAVLLLGHELGRELLGEGLPLAGGIRSLHNKQVGALGQAANPEIERILMDLCQRSGIEWAPPSARAATARHVVHAEGVESQAATLIEQQRWQAAINLLHEGEPLGPRGTNMLGRALLQLGDRDAARHAFERTLASDPGNSIAQRQLANLG